MFRFTLPQSIDFMAKRWWALGLSGTLIVLSLVLLVTRGLNLGIDFTGGTVIEVAYPEPADLDRIRGALEQAGFEGATVQYFGNSQEVLIRIAPREGEEQATLADHVLAVLKGTAGGEIDLRRVEFVGPQVGEELREDGGLAMLYALIGILIYVAFRFEFRFSLGAIFALVHDVIITVGFFALTQLEFNLTVLAAILAVIGYSLNDTIVVFDRIRENFRRLRRGTSAEVINRSITETLSRTVITSFTTLLVLTALAVLGGDVIYPFAVALIVGVVVGTYSSIYIASNAALLMGISREDLLVEKKEGEGLDDLP